MATAEHFVPLSKLPTYHDSLIWMNASVVHSYWNSLSHLDCKDVWTNQKQIRYNKTDNLRFHSLVNPPQRSLVVMVELRFFSSFLAGTWILFTSIWKSGFMDKTALIPAIFHLLYWLLNLYQMITYSNNCDIHNGHHRKYLCGFSVSKAKFQYRLTSNLLFFRI